VAVEEFKPVKTFEDWYTERSIDPITGAFARYALAPCAEKTYSKFKKFKNEMDARTAGFEKLETLADGEVLTKQPDLPNVSSGDVAGLIRRGARNIVQNTPNVEITSKFDDDSVEGIFSAYLLRSKIIGTDDYSNDMQQNLFASTMTALTIGFDCVVPVLLQDATGGWYVQYDVIHYKDVFPEDGAKDVRRAREVFVRRYLSRADVHHLIETKAPGWDVAALQTMQQSGPPNRRYESATTQDRKSGQLPEGYEIVTLYASSGEAFLTFDVRSRLLLRIEKNRHPAKKHPVHFLVLEKHNNHPLGCSMVELIMGRQEFQDLLLNGSMKMWHWGINPTLIGRGVNSAANLGPGKFLSLSNPNANVEILETSTQTLMQSGMIAQQNMGAMVNTIGAADQQMATQAGNGMSATPQGVEAQQSMVDITTNNYQKAVENFFSHYCSYALTIYFHELKAISKVVPNAESRIKLLQAGLPTEKINEDGSIDIDYANLATQYFVRCVPGSLVELEDEKQMRVLQELFVPLSQAMPALASANDQEMIKAAIQTMQYIMGKQIQLSGAADAKAIAGLWQGDDVKKVNERDAKISQLEESLGGTASAVESELNLSQAAVTQLQAQVSQLTENFGILMSKLGVTNEPSGAQTPEQAPAPLP
jgi:hypothetical protein